MLARGHLWNRCKERQAWKRIHTIAKAPTHRATQANGWTVYGGPKHPRAEGRLRPHGLLRQRQETERQGKRQSEIITVINKYCQ